MSATIGAVEPHNREVCGTLRSIARMLWMPTGAFRGVWAG